MIGRWFVTGTDTGVGKTRVAAALCRAWALRGRRVAGMKPVASGCHRTQGGLRNEDALALQAAMNVRAAYEDINPYAFEPAIAPHIAAEQAGVNIDLAVLDRAYERLALQSELLVVEGAGGWLAPLSPTLSFADLAQRWELPVILVVGLRLGCLNHALLTQESVRQRGLRLAGFVINRVDPAMQAAAQNVASLSERIEAPCLGDLPFAPDESPETSAARLDLAPLES